MSGARPRSSDTLRAADERAREIARREFRRPVVVEAGAGTGKTTALVTRVLSWSFGPGWDRASERAAAERGGDRDDRIAARLLRGVVAITFTDKAAAEMSERIADALGAVEDGESLGWLPDLAPALRPDELRSRARALSGALEHLVVQTIHAYCRRLLVENCLDAGLHPNLEVDADGRLRQRAARSAMEAALESSYAHSGDPGFLALAARGIGPREIEAELIELLDAGFPSEALRADPATADRIAALIDRLRDALEHFAAIDRGDLASVGGVATETAEFLEGLRAASRDCPPSSRSELTRFIEQQRARRTDRLRVRLDHWKRGDFNKGEQRAVGDRAEPIAARVRELLPLLDHALSIDLDGLDAARGALAAPLAAAEMQLRAAGALSFAALLRETRSLLRRRPDVAERIRSGIDQLLVDEFQDTDWHQCEIVRALALEGRDDSRPGLFIVGDPKQSIYSWRRADLAAYHAFVEEVLRADGELVRLSVNFRSVPSVLDEVERVVAPVMQAAVGVQPAFEPLVACPKFADSAGFRADRLRSVEYWIPTALDDEGSEPRKTSAGEAARIEGRRLARDLRELHDRHGVAWKSIGVLFRSRGDWEIYLSALREAEIPYAAEGDRSYYRRREIIEAACLVRCILDPNDQLALIAYLRSVAVGVPDAAWIPLWSRGFPDRIAQLDAPDPRALAELAAAIREAAAEVPADVPGIQRIAGWEDLLLCATSDIAQLRESFARDPADVFIEKLRTRTLFEATASARYLGAWRCANLERFFRELYVELESERDTQALLRRLRAALASEQEAEEGRPADMLSDSVKVMTIHGAKGLGFAHVYLMQLHKGAGRRTDSPSRAAEHAGGFEYQLFGTPTLGWDCVLRERARAADAERVRLLYVAMTRAEQRIVMTGLWAEQQQRPGPEQAIELVVPRIESTEGLAHWLSGAAREGAFDFTDRFGARWSLPELEAAGDEAPAKARSRGVRLASESDVAAASRRLVALRGDARARMARSMTSAASARARGGEGDRGAEGSESGVEEWARSADDWEGGVEDWARDAWAARGGEGETARAIGVAVHRVLEEFDFDADAEAEAARQRDALARHLAQIAPCDRADAAVDAGTQLWDRVVGGKLFSRLRELSDRIVARELAVLGPPADERGPVGYLGGVIDLVYRDPGDDRLVVADYKTDSVSPSESAGARADAYAEQGRNYQHLLRDALGLGYTPRFELWFLGADEIVRI